VRALVLALELIVGSVVGSGAIVMASGTVTVFFGTSGTERVVVFGTSGTEHGTGRGFDRSSRARARIDKELLM
jgi:hypothetical protein